MAAERAWTPGALFDMRINGEAADIADSRLGYGTYAMFQIEYAGRAHDTEAVQALVQVPYVSECSVDDNVVVRHNHGSAVIFTEVLEHPPTVEVSSQVWLEVFSRVASHS